MDSGTTLPIDSGVALPDVGVRVDVGVTVDAGLPSADLGVVAMTDAGPLKADDAGAAADTGGAVWMNVAPDSGCGCRVPGPSGSSRAQGAWALAAMAGVLTSMRRRRR
jgi:MYXO-CTERM domain-containing protein